MLHLNQESTLPRLLGDIGGTNARFAWQDAAGAPLTDVATYPCAAYPTVLDAVGGADRKPTGPTT